MNSPLPLSGFRRPTRCQGLNKASLIASAGLLVLAVTAEAANVVVNGDFTANAAGFTQGPGYYGGINGSTNPTEPTGWTRPIGGEGGLNGAGTASNPFGPADDGGLTYAFIQRGPGLLAQTLSVGYNPNQTFTISFTAGARAFNPDVLFRVTIADDTQEHFSTLTENGGVSDLVADPTAFVDYSYTFTAPATFDGTPSILLSNETPTQDLTVNFTNVVLEAVPEPSSGILIALGGLVLLRRQRV